MKLRIYIFILFLFFITIKTIFSQTISIGDIAFLGFNSDNTDQFSIIATNYIESGVPIFFTDAGWNGTNFYASEGHFQWNVPAGGLPTNTIITFTGGGAGGFTIFGTGLLEPGANATSGTLAASASTSSMALSTSGDQIICYTGTIAAPNFIACINFNGSWSPATNSNQTSIPTGLTVGANCALLNNQDNGIVNCLLLPDPSTIADYNNPANWIYNDATRYVLPPVVGPCDFLLPIILKDFYATVVENAIQLNWITSNEINTFEFIVEKIMQDGNFYEIANIKASGNSSPDQFYQFTDDEINNSTTYYRLKIIETDYSYEYSETIVVNNPSDNKEIQNITLYPNPVSEELNIQINFPISEFETLQIINATGKIIYITHENLSFGENNFLINLSDIESGYYFFRASLINGNFINIPFIKSNL